MPVFLLRHGESAHNISIKQYMNENPDSHVLEWWQIEDSFDPKIRDADLTEKGVTQARSLREQVKALNPSLLMMSPLTRNLRTGLEACSDLLPGSNSDSSDHDQKQEETTHVKVQITPALREHTYSSCDLGSPVETLQAAFPHWSEQLQHISGDWWCHDSAVDPDSRLSCREPWQKLQDRTEELCVLIQQAQQEHTNIVIVGHAVLFFALTGEWLANCQLLELDMGRLRERCGCQSPACCCENPDFDAAKHT
jgi:glucosyl-3-phosphoglycerate phosphatase